MTDTDRILQKLEEQGRKIDKQGKELAHLRTDMTSLKGPVSTLEANVEAFRVEQRQANEELLTHIINGYDENAKDHKALENRVNRMEKHLNLPPVK